MLIAFPDPIIGMSPQGRLTPTSGDPAGIAAATSSTIYYSPFTGGRCPIFDGAQVRVVQFTELSLALGTVVPGQLYDVFAAPSGNTIALEKLEWANATVTMTIATPCVVTWTGHGLITGNYVTFTTTGALPTGLSANTQYVVTKVDADTFKLSTNLINKDAGTFIATSGTQSGTHTAHSPAYRATAVTSQNGLWCKSGAPTKLLLGAFLASSTTQTRTGLQNRDVINLYNKLPMPFAVTDTTDSWNYTTATWRQSNNSASNYVDAICIDPYATATSSSAIVRTVARGIASNSTAGITYSSGVGLDATNANITPAWGGAMGSVNARSHIPVDYDGAIPLGYHQLTWLEISQALGTTSWRGDDGGTLLQSGLTGSIMG